MLSLVFFAMYVVITVPQLV